MAWGKGYEKEFKKILGSFDNKNNSRSGNASAYTGPEEFCDELQQIEILTEKIAAFDFEWSIKVFDERSNQFKEYFKLIIFQNTNWINIINLFIKVLSH